MEHIICIVLCLLLFAALLRCSMTKVYRFHRTTCGACKSSKEEWDKFASSCLFSMIRPIEIDLDVASNKALGADFNIEAVPSVIMVKPSGANIKYDGKREASAYAAWISSA